MIEKIQHKLSAFLEADKDVPLLVGFIIGIYPFLFNYSNNYNSQNSWLHFVCFFLLYVGTPILVTTILYTLFKKVEKFRPYKKHLLFVLLIFLTSTLMSQAVYLTLKKKMLLGVLLVAYILSLKLYKEYKKIILIIMIMALFPLFKVIVHIYEDIRPMAWSDLGDNIKEVKFQVTPNVYMIQPDGYVSREVLEAKPYSHKTEFYEWLNNNNFTVYNNFRSNYPASLTSNASMFEMKHHYFDSFLFPAIEMPKARKAIMNSNAVAIFNKNGYDTYFIGHDAYFQQNLVQGNYTHYNINTDDIPVFFNYTKIKEYDVYKDLENGIIEKSNKPKFFFVEKVLPHHVHFYAKGDIRAEERKEYLAKLEEVNVWLKKTVAMINKNDKNAVIIILADHGGWVGMESMPEMLSTKNESLIYSTFGNLAAIQWNGIDHTNYDGSLKSNVNIFRVLFSSLSKNKSYLNHLEEDASYNIRPGNMFTESVHKLIDAKGKVVNEKY